MLFFFVTDEVECSVFSVATSEITVGLLLL